jgi:hypothetical protein
MHQVLCSLLPPDHLQDVFSRIFSFLDQKVPALFFTSATPNSNNQGVFYFPTSDLGKRQMLVEMERMTTSLNSLAGVRPWEFTAIRVLERHLDYELHPHGGTNGDTDGDTAAAEDHSNGKEHGGDLAASKDTGSAIKELETADAEQQHEQVHDGDANREGNGFAASNDPDDLHVEKQDEGTLATSEPIGVGTF